MLGATPIKNTTTMHLKLEDFNLYTPELNYSSKDLIWESDATPNRCTYSIISAKNALGLHDWALNDFVFGYLIPSLSTQTTSSTTRKINFIQHLLIYQALNGCWWGLVPRVRPRMDSDGLRRGSQGLSPS
jgi:hypothetical protein